MNRLCFFNYSGSLVDFDRRIFEFCSNFRDYYFCEKIVIFFTRGSEARTNIVLSALNTAHSESSLKSYHAQKSISIFFMKIRGLNFRNSRKNNGNFLKLKKIGSGGAIKKTEPQCMIIKARIGSGRFVGAITSIFTELEPSQFSKVKIPTILSYFPSLCECLFSFVNSWAVTWSRLNSYLDKKCFRFFF